MPKPLSTIAISAMNAISIAMMLIESVMPSVAPFVIAINILFAFGISTLSKSLKDLPVSLCGITIFANIKPPGADIILAVTKYVGSIPIAIYAAITPPAIVANPPTMIANNSEVEASFR